MNMFDEKIISAKKAKFLKSSKWPTTLHA
jgi:hypothetical protein